MVSVDHGPESIYRAEARCCRCGATDALLMVGDSFVCRDAEWCSFVLRRRRRT
jgi:hypothetical protein